MERQAFAAAAGNDRLVPRARSPEGADKRVCAAEGTGARKGPRSAPQELSYRWPSQRVEEAARTMRFSIFQESRKGGREANEDRTSYAYTRDALLMVVADGMGGHLHGEVASQIAAQLLTEAFQREAKPTLADPLGFLQKRSEEHTSELQSLRHLVCRLLLEKKKKKNKDEIITHQIMMMVRCRCHHV